MGGATDEHCIASLLGSSAALKEREVQNTMPFQHTVFVFPSSINSRIVRIDVFQGELSIMAFERFRHFDAFSGTVRAYNSRQTDRSTEARDPSSTNHSGPLRSPFPK